MDVVAVQQALALASKPLVAQQSIGIPARALRRAHYALASRNSEPCDVYVCGGDSIASSFGSSKRANFLSQKLASYLRQLNPQTAAGGPGFMSVIPDSTALSFPNPVSDAPQSGTVAGAASPANGAPAQGLDSALVYLTTSGQARSWTFTGTGFDLYWFYIAPGSTATATLTVDGTTYGVLTPTSPPPGGTAAGGYFTITAGSGVLTQNSGSPIAIIQGRVRGLTAGTHTVTVTWASNTFYLAGCFGYNGDETSGIRVAQQAWPQRGTRNYVGATYGTGAANQYPAGGTTGTGNNAEQWLANITAGYYLPDIVVLDNFANDWQGTATDVCSPAQNLTNLRSLVAQVKAAVLAGCVAQGLTGYIPSFVVVPPQCVANLSIGQTSVNGGTVVANWPAYAANAYALASGDPDGAVAVWDLGQRLQGGSSSWDNSSYQGLLWTDHVHPSDAGCDFMARGLAGFLTAS